MFEEKVIEKNKELEEKRRKHCEGRYGGEDFEATTASGLPIKAMYGPADLETIDFEDIGVPGEYPYTRGIYPVGYQFQPWAWSLRAPRPFIRPAMTSHSGCPPRNRRPSPSGPSRSSGKRQG